jgi:hypothetical protein
MDSSFHVKNIRKLAPLFPSLSESKLMEIMLKNNHDVDRSIEEALVIVSAEDISSPRSHIPTAKDPKTMFSLPMNFLDIPSTRIVVEFVNEFYVDYTFHVRRAKGTKIGITLCRCDGEICLYSIKSSLQNLWSNDVISTVKTGDILRGINREYFPKETAIDSVSAVLSNSGQYVSLHLRRLVISPTSHSRDDYQEHALVKCIIKRYKGAPPNFTAGLNDSLLVLLKKSLEWNSGFVTQRVPNRLLYKVVPSGSAITAKLPYELLASSSDSRSGTEQPQRRSVVESAVLEPSTRILSRSRSMSLIGEIQMATIKESWNQDVKFNCSGLRPALNFRMLKVIQHRSGESEYVMSVCDIKTGLQWNVTRRYKDISDLKAVKFICS